jgi:hypothetical protein
MNTQHIAVKTTATATSRMRWVVGAFASAMAGAIFLSAPVAHADTKAPGNHNGPRPPATAQPTPQPTPPRSEPGTNHCWPWDCECTVCPIFPFRISAR